MCELCTFSQIRSHIKLWQAADPTLAKAREEAGNEESEKDIRVGFYYSDGLLYRKWRPEGSTEGDVRTCQQLVLPQQCRLPVLRLAHDVPMAGHMGITRTRTDFCNGTTGQGSSATQPITVGHVRYVKKVTLNIPLEPRWSPCL